MAKQNKPAIRFKGFTDAWEQRKLGEFFEKYQNTVYLQDEEEYRQISIRNTGVVEYRCTNKGKNIGRKRQYLIDTDTHPVTLTFTRQTVYEGGIGFVPKELNGAIVTENMPLLEMTNASQDFMKALFNTSGYYKSVINDDTLIGSAQKALHEKQWLDSYVCIPVLDEQKQIGSFFQQLEHLITLHQRKYDKLQVLKKAMLEKMFPKNGSSVPEIRFKGFTDAWEQRKLGELLKTITTGKSVNSDDGAVAVGDIGILKTSCVSYDRFNPYESKPVVKDELQSVKCAVEKDSVIVSRMNTPERVGACGYVSTDFPNLFLPDRLWKLKFQDNVDAYFVYMMLVSSVYKEKITSMASGTSGSMYNIPKETFLNLQLVVPVQTSEQRKIGQVLRQLNDLITLHQRELEKLQNIKKSMLEKMFV